MINLIKSQPAPQCLEDEKKKVKGSYECGDVLNKLKEDFHNKCYLCEEKDITTINIEHFKPHKGDKDLKFDWNNLFLACGHCNNIKLGGYDNILDCTNIQHPILDYIKFEIKAFPKEKAKITALINNDTVNNTIELLDKVYNGSTTLKQLESANLRQKLIAEIAEFGDLLRMYDKEQDVQDKQEIERKIIKHLKPYSQFTAFKRWIILDNPYLKNIFGSYCQ